MVGVAFDWCLHNTGFGVVNRRDGSDDDGGAVHAALDPDDSEPVLAADPASSRKDMEVQPLRHRDGR